MTERSEGPRHIYPIDRFFHANEARLTAGLSPASASAAYLDWAAHLANSPGKQGELFEKAFRKSLRFGGHTGELLAGKKDEPCIEPLPQDHRFRGEDWQQPPFAIYYQAFLLLQQWWHNATVGVEGVSEHDEDVAAFSARQALDVFSPSNFALTNPEVLKATVATGGMNLVRGFQNLFEDWERAVSQRPPVGTEKFRVGKEVAITPGKVVYRNRLIELIQYAPTTETAYPEPVLIVPAWIMKYYILDLSPDNSMVKFLVDQGHTVFMISWKNPTEEDRDLGMDDYLELGVMQALEAVRSIVPSQPAHSVGYCIGGTLLSIAAAALGRDGKDWLKSMTLFAAQTDFTEAGELMLFIDQSQISYLEDLMWDKGYLDTKQMAGAFQLLRSNDLIWSRVVHDYLMGERTPMIDLMAWNADATRMPYRMHSEYLRKLFLKNDFAEGHFYVGDKPAALTDIHIPIFTVGAERDHVAPWESVYKINLLADTDVTFLLTSGGHNAGIISEPGHPGRHHRIATKHEGEPYVGPDEWFASTEPRDGSWWPTWQAWLAEHSGDRVKPPSTGKAKAGYRQLCAAPGTYVLEA
jgi:polyhydroxyalkanoate synthase subunit PhaC